MTTILFRNATVFDGLAEEVAPGLEVLVVDRKIEIISERAIKADGATVVDVAGQTLMPGLIDAHVHVFSVNLVASRNENMPLTLMTAQAVPRIRSMLDRGFTSVRDVAGGDVGIRDGVEQGFIPGPRLFVGGPGLTQTGGHGDHRRRTDSSYDIDYNSKRLRFFLTSGRWTRRDAPRRS